MKTLEILVEKSTGNIVDGIGLDGSVNIPGTTNVVFTKGVPRPVDIGEVFEVVAVPAVTAVQAVAAVEEVLNDDGNVVVGAVPAVEAIEEVVGVKAVAAAPATHILIEASVAKDTIDPIKQVRGAVVFDIDVVAKTATATYPAIYRPVGQQKDSMYIEANTEHHARLLTLTGVKVRGGSATEALLANSIKESHRNGPNANAIAALHDKLELLKDSIQGAVDQVGLDAIDVTTDGHWT